LASAGGDQTVRLWDLADGPERAIWIGTAPAARSVAFSFDKRSLASAGADGAVRLWDVETGHERGVLKDMPAS